ncbi:unnamed protein product, partial [Ixodes hexagonus]
QDCPSISLLVQQNQKRQFTLCIHVSSESVPYVLLQACTLLYPGPLVAFSDPTDVDATDKEIMIAPGSSYPIGLRCLSRDTGTFVVPLALTFQQGCSSLKRFTVVKFLEVSCSKNTALEVVDVNSLESSSALVLEYDSSKGAPAQFLEDYSCKDASVRPLEGRNSSDSSAQLLEDDSARDICAHILECGNSKDSPAQILED